MSQIHAQRLYDVEQVRRLIAPEGKPLHADTVYRMGARGVLAPVKVGPKGGRTLWLGRTLLEYLEGREAA